MYYLGIDLGGTTIKAGLVNEQYQIIDHAVCDTKRERLPSEILRDMAMLCQELIERNGLTENDIRSIGIGCPGKASPRDGIIYTTSNLTNFDNVNVREEIQRYLNVDVYVENDANCAAYGEVLHGAAKGEKNVVVVTLGTGVGGGIILDGSIYRGNFFGAGEIGHQVIKMDEESACGCGRKGCWEQYASVTALIKFAKEAAQRVPESELNSICNPIDNLNAKMIFEAAQNGDQTAKDVLDQFFRYVAVGVANLVNCIEPDMIVLGGGISAQKEHLSEPVIKYVQEEMYGGMALKSTIKTATLGNDAGIIGAAFLGTTLQ